MPQINAYLTFDGNCREAMTFYRDCLGGELNFMTVGETPIADQMAPLAPESIMHSCLKNGSLVLLGSDVGCNGKSQSSAVSLMIDCESEAQINELFEKLSEGGQVLCPLEDTFWNAKFVAFKDRFGFGWNLNYDKSQGV